MSMNIVSRAVCIVLCIAAGIGVGSSMAHTEQNGDDIDAILNEWVDNERVVSILREHHAAMRDAVQPHGRSSSNVVFGIDDQLPPSDFRAVEACVNPPHRFRAGYTVGLVRYTSRDRGGALAGGDIARMKIDEGDYVRRLIGHAASAVDDDKPRINLVFNLGDHRWAKSLGDNWGDRHRMEAIVDEQLDELVLSVNDSSVADDVCEVVGGIEAVLEDVDGDFEAYFDRRDAVEWFDEVEAKLEQYDDMLHRIAPDWTEGRAEAAESAFIQPRRQLQEEAVAFEQAVAERRFDDERQHAQVARQTYDELKRTVDSFEYAVETVSEYRHRLDKKEQDFVLRHREFVPYGSRVRQLLDKADRRLDELQEGIGDDIPPSRLRELDREAREAFVQMKHFVDQTEDSYYFWTYAIPAGVVVAAIAAGLVFMLGAFRRRRRIEENIRRRIDQLDVTVAGLQPRVQQLRERVREVLQSGRGSAVRSVLDDEATETIDLVFVLFQRVRHLPDRMRDEVEGSASREQQLKIAVEFLDEATIEISPADSEGDTVLQHRLEGEYTFSGREAFDVLDDRIERAGQLLEKAVSSQW